jgi:hypothetical protein
MIGAYRALAGTHYFLGDFESSQQYAMRDLQIWRSGGIQSHPGDLLTRAVGCLYFGGSVRVAYRRDQLVPYEHGGRDLASEGVK